MIDASIFVDNQARCFIPYQGWKIVNDDEITQLDSHTIDYKGPFELICDSPADPRIHTKHNLKNSNGEKLLPFPVRKIRYYQEGYYLLYDDNEDELTIRGDVKGGFLAKDFLQKMNVLRTDGTLLSDEWFKEVCPQMGFFRTVYYDRRWTYIDIHGHIISPPESLKFGCHLISPIQVNSATRV